ncbi:MAG: alpha-L-fucosidase [Ginsengibacter sp.]
MHQLPISVTDIASKGGNYLLNAGPKSDGTFPPESADLLEGIGSWM